MLGLPVELREMPCCWAGRGLGVTDGEGEGVNCVPLAPQSCSEALPGQKSGACTG